MKPDENGCYYRVVTDSKGRKHYPVQCEEQNRCSRCGWNPEVEQQRIAKIKERLCKTNTERS